MGEHLRSDQRVQGEISTSNKIEQAIAVHLFQQAQHKNQEEIQEYKSIQDKLMDHMTA